MSEKELDAWTKMAVGFLKKLIETPSLSKEEQTTADLIQEYFENQKIEFERNANNIWAKNLFFKEDKSTILLNSHHDTVKPNAGYTLDPYKAIEMDNKIYGLGSNDAGGALVSLLAVFSFLYTKENLPFNLVFAASAEEEISGVNGMELLVKHLPKIDLAIVGEPTLMQMATAEKGLMVLDCYSKGIAGHAARNEGVNAIYEAMTDIYWFKTFQFPKVSTTLGPIKMNVTQISAGTQHNVVPDICHFVVDVRATDAYPLEETLSIIQKNIKSEAKPRSMRLKPSFIEDNHPIVLKGKLLGLSTYGSPTLSDQALMPFKSIKIGPGDSARSHTADEFIFISEIKNGIKTYAELLDFKF